MSERMETDSFCTNLFTFKPMHPTKMYYIDREQSFRLASTNDSETNRFDSKDSFTPELGIVWLVSIAMWHWNNEKRTTASKRSTWNGNQTVCLLKWYPVKLHFSTSFRNELSIFGIPEMVNSHEFKIFMECRLCSDELRKCMKFEVYYI